MKVLFATMPQKTHFYPMVPTAWALRTAGHEVRVASSPDLTDVIVHTGLTAVPAGLSWGDESEGDDGFEQIHGEAMEYVQNFDYAPPDPRAWHWEDLLTLEHVQVPTFYGAINDAMVDDLVAYAKAWQPDLVIWETFTVAGAIAARVTGAAHARLVWGPDVSLNARQEFLRRNAGQPLELREDPTAEWLEWTLERYGGHFDEELLTGQWTIDPTTPALRLDVGVETLSTQWIPYNGPATVPGWLTAPVTRPRVCLTLGMAFRDTGEQIASLADLLRSMSGLDAEIVATLDEKQRTQIGPLPGNVRVVDFVPLNDLLPTCAAIVHHGGCGTTGSSAWHGVPQIILAFGWDTQVRAERLEAAGAGLGMPAAELTVPALRDRIVRLLEDPSFAEGAARLRRQARAQPSPNDLVALLEKLVARHRV